MKEKTVKYQIVEGEDCEQLSRNVAAGLADGFTPIGGPVCLPRGGLGQAMVKTNVECVLDNLETQRKKFQVAGERD